MSVIINKRSFESFTCLDLVDSLFKLPMKGRKRLAREAFDIFATHSGLVHDVTDTDCWAQNSRTHGRVTGLA